MIVKFKKLNDRAIMPTKGTPYSAGADLYSAEENSVVIEPGQTVFIGTGLVVEIPEGYAGLVYARSGIACKRGLAPANKVGVIDSDFRGEVKVVLYNQSSTTQTVERGERIAQLVVTPFLNAEYVEAAELSDTSRGAGGFGSTGKL